MFFVPEKKKIAKPLVLRSIIILIFYSCSRQDVSHKDIVLFDNYVMYMYKTYFIVSTYNEKKHLK